MTAGLDSAKLASVLARENDAFVARTPKSGVLHDRAAASMPDGVPMAWMAGLFHHRPLFAAGGQGSQFEDVDGNSYIDFNLADLSNTVGYGETPVSRRIAEQSAKGPQFMQPTEDAIVVAEELAGRTGLPKWQFTISASSANQEVIRIARAFTGRSKIVMFEGKYHGHIDATMAKGGAPQSNIPAEPEAIGISPQAAAHSVNVPFNDLAALKLALAQGDVALVIAEPALTNCSLVLPDPSFWQAAYRMSKEAGAIFAFDETHTWQLAYGGFLRTEHLAADVISLGKGLGSGVPLGAYGMTEELCRFVEENLDDYTAPVRGLAIGGTTFGNALTMAATRAMLEEVATEDAYERMARLGTRLADGIDSIIAAFGLPWKAFRYRPRTGFCLTPNLPRTYDQAAPSVDPLFSDARRLYMANRGVWEAITPAGPQVSFAHSAADMEAYLNIATDFVKEVRA